MDNHPNRYRGCIDPRCAEACIHCGAGDDEPCLDSCDGPKDFSVFGFSVWPNELGTWEPSMFTLFRQYPRIEMEMTDDEWSAFSSSLERQGLTLREVERIATSPSAGSEQTTPLQDGRLGAPAEPGTSA